MHPHLARIAVLCASLLAASAASCGSDPADSCTPGAEGCECSEGVCLAGLECRSDVCVPLDPGDTSSAPGTSDDGDADASASSEAGPSSSAATDAEAGSSAGDTMSGGCQGTDGTIDCPCLAGNDCLGDLECDGEQTCVCLNGTPCGESDCVADVQADNRHCGRCGNECTVFLDSIGQCEQGECLPTWSECVPGAEATTCDAICQAQGQTCVPAGCTPESETWIEYVSARACEQDTVFAMGTDDCSTDLATVIEPTLDPYMRCCCTQ
jgi:hypothetical protein